MPSEEELRKMNVKQIKAHVREMNEHYAIRGYSKLKKDQLINAILTAHMRIKKGQAPAKKTASMGTQTGTGEQTAQQYKAQLGKKVSEMSAEEKKKYNQLSKRESRARGKK